MRYLILGAAGMAGHMLSAYLLERGYHVTTFTRRPVNYGDNFIGDVMDTQGLQRLLSVGRFDAVVNCVGLLNQEAEMSRSKAVLLNSYLPHELSRMAEAEGTRVIQISTDCVFSGRTGNYTEASTRDGESFYDRTKALGELDNGRDLTFRMSIVGPDMSPLGIGLLNWFMHQEGPIEGYVGAYWTGVTTLTLAKAVDAAVQVNLKGLYHLVNNEVISKYELLQLFNQFIRMNEVTINPSNKVKVDKSLMNTRSDFGFSVPSYAEMVEELAEWMGRHKALYPHYPLYGGGTNE